MSKFRFLFVFLVSISVCGATTVTIRFTGLPTVFDNGTYNGFATATINGIPNQLLLCDDYSDHTFMPSSENLVYDYSNLVSPAPLQSAKYVPAGGPTANDVKKYEEAAVLLWQMNGLGASATPGTITDYQYAIWNLFTPSATLFRANQSALQTNALALVNSDAPWLTSVYAGLAIYTPTAKFAGNQEFLELTEPVATPEPTMAGLLIGIFSVAGMAAVRRRMHKV